MKLFIHIFSCLGLCLLTACAGTVDDIVPESEYIKISSAIPLEEALATANQVFSQIETTTRASRREVSSVKTIQVPVLTRGGETEKPVYYLVNYGDEDGFAVLSANRNLGEIFAIGEEGHLEMSDTVDNRILANFFNNLNTYASLLPPITRDSTFLKRDSVYQLLLCTERVAPMMNKKIQRWLGSSENELYQSYPKRAICIAQAIAHFGKPEIWTKRDGERVSLNWSLIRSYEFSSRTSSPEDAGFKEVRKLLDLVTESFFEFDENDNTYRCVFSFIDEREISLGYKIGHFCIPPLSAGESGFDQPWGLYADMWRTALQDGQLITASCFIGSKSADDGLGCVVDGYFRYQDHPKLSEYGTDTMFHCVWGRGCTYNGYYALMDSRDSFVQDAVQKDYNSSDQLPDIHSIDCSLTFKPEDL